MRKTICAGIIFFVSGLAIAAELSEKFAKRLESADANYQQAIQKADNVRFYAVQKATQERVRLLKMALADATKAGDFDAAMELKIRLAAAETSGGVWPRPKNPAKFGNHEYAILDDKMTWHMAKRRCEEMGGHLVTFETPQEVAFVAALCRDRKISAWIGLSNESDITKMVWINGQPLQSFAMVSLDDPERDTFSGGVAYWQPFDKFTDYSFGGHIGFVCEWDD